MSDTPPITATVARFCEISGIGITTVYAMIKDGRLERIKIGRRTLIVMDSYRRLVDHLRDGSVGNLGSSMGRPPHRRIRN